MTTTTTTTTTTAATTTIDNRRENGKIKLSTEKKKKVVCLDWRFKKRRQREEQIISKYNLDLVHTFSIWRISRHNAQCYSRGVLGGTSRGLCSQSIKLKSTTCIFFYSKSVPVQLEKACVYGQNCSNFILKTTQPNQLTKN